MAETKTSRPNLADPSLYINRELSWLQFNDRVLAQATDRRHPLLERARFISISETNLDEFFMIRVAGLQQQVVSELPNPGADGLTPEEQLARIREHSLEFFKEQRQALAEILKELEGEGIRLVPHKKLRAAEKRELRERFASDVLPILTPLAIDPAHPFPHISNLSLNLLVVIEDRGRNVMARVKVPTSVGRFMRLPPEEESETGDGSRQEIRLVRVEEVISANLDELFPGKDILASYVFQVTRNADYVIEEDEASDLLQVIEDEIASRWFGQSVRLMVTEDMPENLRFWLARNLEIDAGSVYAVPEPLGLADIEALTHLDRPDLLYPPFTPRIPQEIRNSRSITRAVRQGDILLYHPYESFAPVVEFVRAAASDPNVLAIKQTLYRVGSNSPIVEALSEARDEQTQVAVLVELKARFDEQPNIGWARKLESQGVHVAYGLVGLKTHAKLCLVVRREGEGLRRYIHLGTGNYNPGTARIYTDFSYFTDDPELAEDVSDLFNHLTGYSDQTEYKSLLVAPHGIRSGVLKLIQEQIDLAKSGKSARITCKSNSLTDPQVIEALYQASQAGVKVDLILRGICCLRPGVENISENIRVVSIVGRFLEHARVFAFGEGENEKIYIGSADLMQRNLDRRVEQVFPLREPAHRRKVRRILDLQLADTVNAWELKPDGEYERIVPGNGAEPLDSQAALLEEPG
ncbi:polyphosphate kinase 1 [Rubrobacter radiotolerans]|uniref:Polyphosphate kinase n=1 Tax=Rubrobacter radiotolerans TaxID=42256 RepID=A0A023X0M5_RUBRA|nr:polyphosphate kinase 1 [Rubrobacter radiotolerans]AHY45589.1 polyphosphate kinase 1 [Rubrobacter radiotolerans]MDX5893003.1 polyphosphate kinase 1 [Rubrobacter radiotolerans]SMC02886.1 polyphosphate kinase [Rubrobacter radiotolerans DSM 5868]